MRRVVVCRLDLLPHSVFAFVSLPDLPFAVTAAPSGFSVITRFAFLRWGLPAPRLVRLRPIPSSTRRILSGFGLVSALLLLPLLYQSRPRRIFPLLSFVWLIFFMGHYFVPLSRFSSLFSLLGLGAYPPTSYCRSIRLLLTLRGFGF